MRLSHNGSASGRSAERRGRGRGGGGGGGRPRATRSADGGEAGERGGRGGGGGQARAGHGRGRGGGKWVEKWAKLQAAARITGRHFGREDPYFSQFFVVGASARHLAVEVGFSGGPLPTVGASPPLNATAPPRPPPPPWSSCLHHRPASLPSRRHQVLWPAAHFLLPPTTLILPPPSPLSSPYPRPFPLHLTQLGQPPQ